MIIGIDPGFSGGISTLTPSGEFVDGIRMPILHLNKREMVDAGALTRFAQPYMMDFEAVVIEAVHSMPKQGVASTFKFGRAAGAVEAWALAVFGKERLAFVAPRTWKRDMGLSSDKRAALKLAETKWPKVPEHVKWNILRNDGIAEAALIADWHRTQLGR